MKGQLSLGYSSGTYTGTGNCLDALGTCSQCLADENYDGYMPSSFCPGVRMSDDRREALAAQWI